MASATRRITVREVTQAVQATDSAVLLVTPRVLQRVIRIDRRLPTFGLAVPHHESYFLSRERLFDVVSRFELDLDIHHSVPDSVILLERPDEEELLERSPAEVFFDYWRLLFHVRVHLALEQRVENGLLSNGIVLERLRRIGMTAYAEIRSVLHHDELAMPPRTEISTYVEFAAVFLEKWYFAPDQLAWYFPALADPSSIAALLSEDLDHAALHEATRITGAAELSDRKQDDGGWSDSAAVEVVDVDPLKPSPPAYWRLLARAERVGAMGNVAKAAILRSKAARQALPDRVRDAAALAHAELERLARRLRPVLNLTEDESQDWAAALVPLLKHVDRGLRSPEARLLYDLQKVCIEQERGVYALDLWTWARTLGRRPIRRPLPLLRQVLVAKHLQNASRQLTMSRLSGEARTRLSILIRAATERAKTQLRDSARPHITAALEQEGLQPRNAPERVAFRKIVEELLDRIVEHGYLNMGHLRDTLSQNNLKLHDLTSIWELLFGDLLLRIDRRLSEVLDGVHHHGPIYLRMSQRLSALAFGTRRGRLLTRNVAIPYGGAYLILEFVWHVYHLFAHRDKSLAPELDTAEQLTSDAPTVPNKLALPESSTLFAVLLFGTFLLMLIRSEAFRSRCLQILRRAAQGFRLLFFDLPARLLRLTWIRKFLDSQLFGVVLNYVFKPLILTMCGILPYEQRYGDTNWRVGALAFLAINLLLNSPLGRYADLLLTEQLVRGWRELQIRVFAAALRMVNDLFQQVLQTMEQVLYTVDEWLRFRTGERRLVLVIKALLGSIWALVTYVVRIYITLLIEPQVNPIKHFPVVTVSHKIMFPLIPYLTSLIATPFMPLGSFFATAIAGITVFLLPGVFGFLAWELKENWKLYASNRPSTLRPIRIGSHNENMARFLRFGFHSGTVPKLFGKLRQAARNAARTGNWKAVHKHRATLQHVEDRVRRFVERELISLLSESPAWRDVPLEIRGIEVGCHQFVIQLWHGDTAYEPLHLSFIDSGGWLLATLTQHDWLDAQDEVRQRTFFLALEGLCKYAGVDLLWDQLVAELKRTWWWCELNSDGLLTWPERKVASTILIKLRDSGAAAAITPPPLEVVVPPDKELPRLVFAKSPIFWREWVAAWEPAEPPAGDGQFPVPLSEAHGWNSSRIPDTGASSSGVVN